MRLDRNLLIGAASALAVSALPFNLESVAVGSLELSSAYAKSGGNGNGNGNGHGSHGGSGAHGKSADAGSRGKSGNVRAGSRHADKLLGAMFGKETKAEKRRGRVDVKMAKSKAKSLRAQQVAALPETVSIPQAKPKEKNLNARLAGLNSLKRNYHAYLNSQSPKMASIRAFVMASAQFDLARERLDAANARLSLTEAEFEALLASTELTPYDDAVGIYDDPTLAELADRLAQLESATVAPEDMEAWEAEVADLRSVLDSQEAAALADAEEAAEQAELAADQAAVGTDDAALKQALLDAANKNRVAQYGDDYIDDDIMDWAKDVLGVGDSFGKIDQVRETLAIDSQ